MKEKTFFKNRIRPEKHNIEIEKIKEHFITPISSLLVDGVDFALFRVYKHEDSEEWSYDIVYEWSWDWTSYYGDTTLSQTITDCTYDEVEENGEGYYIATILTEREHIEEDDGVWRAHWWRTPENFIMFVPLKEIETPKSPELFGGDVI